jgi:hypothetical protein
MRRLVSVILTLAFVSVVPALAAAELSLPESCCSLSGDGGSMMATSCCAMASCSMSSRPEPVRAPNHNATTSESGQKLPAPKPVTSLVAALAAPAASPSFERLAELLDPSPPPTTSERLAVFSCYLI